MGHGDDSGGKREWKKGERIGSGGEKSPER
jgi:hypothetical protein